jgi:peptide subunit release factor 1 (eRF1)
MQNRTLNTQIVDEELVAIEQQRTRQLIKRLEAAQGNGTSVITLTLSCF